MYLDTNYIVSGEIDISQVKEYLEDIPEEAWDLDWRRIINPNFNESHTLWMRSMPFTKDNIYRIFDSSETCRSQKFKQAYEDLHLELEKMFNGVIIRSGLIRLHPGKSVHRHSDGTHSIFRYCHRLILPIKTNPLAVFRYDDGDHIFKEGVIYDTNPYLPHSTHNFGEEIRYQFVIDLLPSRSIGKDVVVEWHGTNLEEYKKFEPKSIPNHNRSLENWEKILEQEKINRKI